jgi:hypothetical protein
MSEQAPPSLPTPWDKSRRLPDYKAVFAVDAKNFTGLPALLHAPVSQLVSQIADEALEEAGLSEVKDIRSFPANTGDGVVFGLPPWLLPFIIWPYLAVLDSVLGRYNARTPAARIRLRVSINVGPLPDSGDPGDGNGTARTDTHRLLDSQPVKALLAAASEQTTHLVAILSQRAYEDAVLGGYTGLHPHRFTEVTATVPGKQFSQQAWLFVPSPPGDLLGQSVLRPGPKPRSDTAEESPSSAQRVPNREASQHVTTGIAHSGTLHGGIRFTAGLSNDAMAVGR